ncbi:MAG: GerMN domain-containing protein [Armatimonadetes bacterium]|nr:GerMN domain-containing protein [Armatimonadota bacterium]
MKILSFPRRFAALLAVGTVFLASCQPREDTQQAVVTPAPLKVIDTIFVPGDDALHPKKVSRSTLDTQLRSGGNPTPALDEIIKTAPQWFPKGARVEDVKENSGVVTVLLSPQFGNEKHWSKGERITELAIYSLVNTVAKEGKKVELTIEGKPMTTLGQFDASEPLEANLDLNAKK